MKRSIYIGLFKKDNYMIINLYRRICDGNYRSVTQLDFQPYRDPSGLEVFPNGVHHSPSAFVRQKALTVPRNTEVNSLINKLI